MTDTERLNWLIEHISDPWPIAHSEWDADARAAIDARIALIRPSDGVQWQRA